MERNDAAEAQAAAALRAEVSRLLPGWTLLPPSGSGQLVDRMLEAGKGIAVLLDDLDAFRSLQRLRWRLGLVTEPSGPAAVETEADTVLH